MDDMASLALVYKITLYPAVEMASNTTSKDAAHIVPQRAGSALGAVVSVDETQNSPGSVQSISHSP